MAGGDRLRLAINLSFIILVLSLFLDVPGAAARVEGQRCGCTAGRVRLIFNFSFPLLVTILILEEGLGPLVGLGFFSASPPPSKVVDFGRVPGPRRIYLGNRGLE